uniref:Zinc finger CCCH domain-containing protein 14 n=1 Tax=Periophthalmus magnuspinnatus TaxID=409849 RepID=A0A3B4AX42_9GOBI
MKTGKLLDCLPVPSEAVIDIKPDMDDDLISENHVETGTSSSRTRSSSSRPSIEIYRPGQSKLTSVSSAESHSRHVESRSSRSSRSSASKESRKRKAPVASSVVRVSRTDEDSDDVEDDDTSYGSRGLSSRVSLPSKAERKPTLPPAKQANRNLILKAISEAQDSITKTTAYPLIPQRQTVPVAPRTRLSTSEEMTAAIQLVQEHLHSLAPRPPPREGVIESNSQASVSVLQRLQKVSERCKFWPACKSGDECPYHHPTTQCKTFPNCKFGDKCLFIHPNCKYDAKCTKPDCPFTHVSRRMPPVQTTTVCRFFPQCKKMDCPFYHPKPCRFAAQCKRVGCSFYHPTTSLPPRHALKWTKAQPSD